MFRFLRQWFASDADSSGARGERAAADWLERERHFQVVARNWHSPHDRREEIDLVCRDGEALVFVEVKTRAPDALVPGFYAVDARKKRVLRRAVRTYLRHLPDRPRTFRCDVVVVVFPAAKKSGGATARNAGEPEIRHFQNVQLFSKFFQ